MTLWVTIRLVKYFKKGHVRKGWRDSKGILVGCMARE